MPIKTKCQLKCKRYKSVKKIKLFRKCLLMNQTILYLLLLLLSLMIPYSCREVLRLPHFLQINSNLEHILHTEYNRKRRFVKPNWELSIKKKAKTFGQSDNEIARVNYYLNRLKELNNKKHFLILMNKNLNNATKKPLNIKNHEFKKQVNAWKNKRMFDFNEFNNLEENSRFFEGDIILSGDQAEEIYKQIVNKKKRRVKRKFIGSVVRRWDTTKPIYYSFDGSHTSREQKIIELALEHWHNITCLNFQQKNGEPKGNQIVFTDVDGCASNVGKHPLEEPQFVSLAPECIRLGVIAHEVAHALGFWHEQSRADRDYFVRVRWENIDKDSKGQFLKEQLVDVDNGNVPYDYGSIMHYRSKAFAKSDDLFTMNTFISDYQRTIGQRDQLSFNDIRLMNTIYCNHTCTSKLPCQRGGYTDPKQCDRCRCPDGFTGKLCNEIMPGYGTKCGGRVELRSNGNWHKISSPNYPQKFHEGQECSWLLVAPHGKHVELQFINEFEMYCKVRHSLCMDYVEIKNSTDFSNTGMRYCCYGTPKGSIVSATEDMLVLFRSFYRSSKGFMAQVRTIPYIGQWSNWTEQTPCSASCGACGIRQRKRQCIPKNAFCLGDDIETEVCNRKPCKGICSRKQFENSDCTGFLSLLKGLNCKTEKMKLEECNEICCEGFSLVNGLCTLF